MTLEEIIEENCEEFKKTGITFLKLNIQLNMLETKRDKLSFDEIEEIANQLIKYNYE